MPNISNIFYWDIQTNSKVELNNIDNIKTKNLIKCKELENTIFAEPFDETDSNFKETKVWLFIAEIKKYYIKINKFKIKFKKDNSWDWHTFIKKENEDIELVDEADQYNELNNDTIVPIGTQKIDDVNSEEENEELTSEEIEEIGNKFNELINTNINVNNSLNDTTEEIKFNLDRIKNIFKEFNIDKNIDVNKIKKVKEEILHSKSLDELQFTLLSCFENIEDISNNDISNIMKYDSSSDREFGQADERKGMGIVFTVQSIINNGSIKPTDDMYVEIWNNLKQIYNDNKNKIKNKNENDDIEKNYKLFESDEKESIESIKTKLCVIYGRFLKNWKEGKGNENVKGSNDFRNNMTCYFPEILSPFIILWGDKEGNNSCIDSKGKKAIELLKEKVGQSFINSNISFPQSAYQPLFDSVLYFYDNNDNSYKCIRLSTKGGRDGKGAQASILGLLSYIYKKDKLLEITPDMFNKRFFSYDFSNYINCYQDYMKAFAMKKENNIALKLISALMLASSTRYHIIINAFFDVIAENDKNIINELNEKLNSIDSNKRYRKKPAMKKTLETRLKGIIIQEYMNNHKEFQDCVLSALKYASYDFAQINSKETSENEDGFHYNIFVQYPAIFEGKINFEFMQGLKFHKLKFHIIGDNIKSEV